LRLRYRIGRKFGAAKAWHRLGRYRYRGLDRFTIQSYLTFMLLSLKRMVHCSPAHDCGSWQYTWQPPWRPAPAAGWTKDSDGDREAAVTFRPPRNPSKRP
jgi:hypothetical protein